MARIQTMAPVKVITALLDRQMLSPLNFISVSSTIRKHSTLPFISKTKLNFVTDMKKINFNAVPGYLKFHGELTKSLIFKVKHCRFL